MIQQLSAPELKAMIDSGAPFEFVDVRNQWSATSPRLTDRVC
jgi:hypothetical protein